MLIRRIGLFEQADQSVPVLGYRRDGEKLLWKPVDVLYIVCEMLRAVGRKFFVMPVRTVRRSISAYADLFDLCVAAFQYRCQDTVHLAEFLAVVPEVGDDIVFVERIVYV